MYSRLLFQQSTSLSNRKTHSSRKSYRPSRHTLFLFCGVRKNQTHFSKWFKFSKIRSYEQQFPKQTTNKGEQLMKTLYFLFSFFLFIPISYADVSAGKITVIGKSISTVEAQYSIIHSEVKFISKTIEESHASLLQTLNNVSRALNNLGLPAADITKSIVTQGSEYNWQNNSRVHVGYHSTCALKLKVNDMDILHRIYNELAQHSSLTIGWTEYGRNDELELRNKELQKALLAARTKAEIMAATLNTEIGRVLRIEESGSGPVGRPEVLYAERSGNNSGGGTFGSVDITGIAVVEFELK